MAEDVIVKFGTKIFNFYFFEWFKINDKSIEIRHRFYDQAIECINWMKSTGDNVKNKEVLSL